MIEVAMRKREHYKIADSTQRTVTKFLWLPKRLRYANDGPYETRQWEKAEIVQFYSWWNGGQWLDLYWSGTPLNSEPSDGV